MKSHQAQFETLLKSVTPEQEAQLRKVWKSIKWKSLGCAFRIVSLFFVMVVTIVFLNVFFVKSSVFLTLSGIVTGTLIYLIGRKDFDDVAKSLEQDVDNIFKN